MRNPPSESDRPAPLPPSLRNKIFIMFLLADLFLNYDSGVIPASLLEIVKEIELGYKEQALLGSLVYLGLSFASLFTSPIFSKFGASKVCAYVLIVNSLNCFVFSITNIKAVLFITRFLMGVTEAFIVVYGPVWVNNYSPRDKSATWMGILHSCTIFGMISGYIIAGITINFMKGVLNWRFAIQIQGIAEIPIAVMFFFEDEQYINVNIKEEEIKIERNLSLISEVAESGNRYHSDNVRNDVLNSIPDAHGISERPRSITKPYYSDTVQSMNNCTKFFHQAIEVLSNKLYVCVTFGLCSIYFIVTGIQFWMTAYLIKIIGADPMKVIITFSFATVTAPLSGILIGGTFADQYGGYKGNNVYKAIQMCAAFGFISFIFAFPLGFLYSFIYVVTLLWVFLFFGATIVPITTGIMISVVRKECQATSSSLSQLIFNLGGYFLSPFLTGFIMDCFDDKRLGFIWGMRVVLWWVVFALISLGSALIIEYKKRGKLVETERSEGMNEDMEYFVRLEIRRRMALSSR